MERELMITGIGGQGVQFAGRLVAEAAVAEQRQVQLFGSYGGMMRGGDTAATVIVGNSPIEAPPTVGRTWSAIVMHHEHWEGTRDRLAGGAVVVLNSTVFGGEIDRDAFHVIDVPASEIAATLGNVMLASCVATGAYAAATSLVGLEALIDAVPRVLPPYRRQHVDANERALRAGFDCTEREQMPAWAVTGAAP